MSKSWGNTRRLIHRCPYCKRRLKWEVPLEHDMKTTVDEKCFCGAHLTLTVTISEAAGVYGAQERYLNAGKNK